MYYRDYEEPSDLEDREPPEDPFPGIDFATDYDELYRHIEVASRYPTEPIYFYLPIEVRRQGGCIRYFFIVPMSDDEYARSAERDANYTHIRLVSVADIVNTAPDYWHAFKPYLVRYIALYADALIQRNDGVFDGLEAKIERYAKRVIRERNTVVAIEEIESEKRRAAWASGAV